eukprot:958402-Rhodomonas_salina.1
MSIITRMIAKLYPQKEHRALMLGLDTTGRTTMLYKLKLNEIITTIPTIGFNVESVNHKGARLTLWDVGGCDKIRPLWRHYYDNTQVVMYFFDSNDQDRFREALDELKRLMAEEKLYGCVLLVWANKQDLPNAMPAAEIKAAVAAELGTEQTVWIRWEVFGCSVITGDGMEEGLDWMVSTLSEKPSRQPPPDGGGDGGGGGASAQPTEEMTEDQKLEAMLLEWLEREDEEDDAFVQKLHDYTLERRAPPPLRNPPALLLSSSLLLFPSLSSARLLSPLSSSYPYPSVCTVRARS